VQVACGVYSPVSPLRVLPLAPIANQRSYAGSFTKLLKYLKRTGRGLSCFQSANASFFRSAARVTMRTITTVTLLVRSQDDHQKVSEDVFWSKSLVVGSVNNRVVPLAPRLNYIPLNPRHELPILLPSPRYFQVCSCKKRCTEIIPSDSSALTGPVT
jgi:hypothetical protein